VPSARRQGAAARFLRPVFFTGLFIRHALSLGETCPPVVWRSGHPLGNQFMR
jgi:hypothetical protein